ncbi:MAG: hypothetical protein ACKO0Z_06965 [Betaproteobacteria bacterium]
MNETVEILKRAREIIAAPGAWTKGKDAINEKGEGVNPKSPNACAFCSYGAVLREVPLGEHFRVIDILREALPKGYEMISLYNDHSITSHDDVLALFDRAIEISKAKA